MSREELQRAIENIESAFEDIRLLGADALSTALAAMREQQERENPHPLTLEELRERANKPYWHKSLTGRESKWLILDDHIAARPEDYHYGEWWIAYDYQPKENNHEAD